MDTTSLMVVGAVSLLGMVWSVSERAWGRFNLFLFIAFFSAFGLALKMF